MKKALGIALLATYLFGWVAPFMPHAAFFFQQEYIAEIFCINQDKPELMCNGQCYLMQQIALAEQLAEAQQPTTPTELPALQLDEPIVQWMPPQADFWAISLDKSMILPEGFFPPLAVELAPPTPPPQFA